jgi:predicted nucleic acid-binding protein
MQGIAGIGSAWKPFDVCPLPLATTEAVLTELFYLVGPETHTMEAAWRFVSSGAIILASIDHSELPQIHRLMSKYADHPIDFADATLVHVARRDSLSSILTVDHADFYSYRIDGRRKFNVIPSAGQ